MKTSAQAHYRVTGACACCVEVTHTTCMQRGRRWHGLRWCWRGSICGLSSFAWQHAAGACSILRVAVLCANLLGHQNTGGVQKPSCTFVAHRRRSRHGRCCCAYAEVVTLDVCVMLREEVAVVVAVDVCVLLRVLVAVLVRVLVADVVMFQQRANPAWQP